VVSFTPRPLYPQGKRPRYPLDKRLGGPQYRSGRRGKEKILPLLGLEKYGPIYYAMETKIAIPRISLKALDFSSITVPIRRTFWTKYTVHNGKIL
jgi:hypothetical protein